MRHASTFGTAHYALSASSFSHAEMPLGLALRLYDAFSCAVQRKCTCAVARSLAGMGGLPLFGAFMDGLYAYTNNPCNTSLGMI